MPQGIKDRWVGRMPGFRQIKVRGHVEVRLTLEDDFLDSVPRPLQDPDHSRVQRRSGGEASEVLEHLLAYVRPSFVDIFDCGHMLDSTLPLPEHAESDVVHVRRYHPPSIVTQLQSRGKLPILGLLRQCESC